MANRLQFTLSVSGLADNTFGVTAFEHTESLSAPFACDLTLVSRHEQLKPDNIIDQQATLILWQAGKAVRYIQGVICSFSKGDTHHLSTDYRMTLVPALARLALRHNSRIFQQQSVPEIMTVLLQEMGIDNYAFSLSAKPAKREFCVQYRETDLAFLSRIAAEEGISYTFNHEADKHTVLFFDDSAIMPSEKSPFPYHALASTYASDAHIRSLALTTRVRPVSATLKDYSFKKPAYNFLNTAQASDAPYQCDNYAHFDYPGRYKNDVAGKAFTRYRLEQLRADAIEATGSGNLAIMTPGHRFTLTGHPDAPLNRSWLPVRVIHQGAQAQAKEEAAGDGVTTYNNRFELIPADKQWRPALYQKPLVDGPMIATVTGPKGEEIFCDEFGRVKVKFPWDRYSVGDDNSSCWVRVSQGWAGAQYGMVALPRVGHEVIVSFLNGDPDQPIITGRTFNAVNPLPYPLPEHKTRTVMRTETHQGDGYNELRFEDQAGKEEIFLHAQKDMNQLVENDHKSHIKHDCHLDIGNERKIHIQANDNLTVEGEYRQHTTGKHTLSTDDGLHLKQGADMQVEAGKEIHLKAGNKLILEAGNELTLKVGGSFIKIDASGVSQVGTIINLNSGGSAGSGSGFAGALPEIPDVLSDIAPLQAAAAAAKATALKPPKGKLKPTGKATQTKAKKTAATSAAKLTAAQVATLKKAAPVCEECEKCKNGACQID